MKSGELAVGIVLVSVAAALTGYVVRVVGESVSSSIEASHAARELTEDRDAMEALADRLRLPDSYATTDCEELLGDSRCWHTALTAEQASTDVQAALAAAGVTGVTAGCTELHSVDAAHCTVRAPFSHDREVTFLIAPPFERLGRDALHDPAAIAAAGTDVTFIIPTP